MTAFSVYIIAGSQDEAERIAEALVGERLAACVNILGPVTSVYRWRGKIERDEEVAMLAKTSEHRIHALIDRAAQMHSYDTPCITAFPISAGDAGYLDWIDTETTKG